MNAAARAEIIRQIGPAPTTPLEALRHILVLYADTPDDQTMIIGTSNIYGPSKKTGLTMGDLRAINDQMSPPEEDTEKTR